MTEASGATIALAEGASTLHYFESVVSVVEPANAPSVRERAEASRTLTTKLPLVSRRLTRGIYFALCTNGPTGVSETTSL